MRLKLLSLFAAIACACAFGAQSASAWHIVPLVTNSGYCQNQPPNDWKNQLTTRYGFDQVHMDYYVFCSNNSGRDIVYIFAPKLYVLVGSIAGYEYNANRENILARSSDVSTGLAKYIHQNFYNGQWYDYSTNNDLFTPTTIGGVSYRGLSDFNDYGNSVNPGKKPIYTSAPGSFDLLNPFNVTDFTNYQYSLFTEPYDPAPSIDYEVIDHNAKFQSKAPTNITSTGIHWLVTYGSIDGDPQLQTWETDTSIVGSDIEPFNFEFPFIADSDEENKFGSYNIQAWFTDDSGGRTSFITSMLLVLRANTFNYFEGNCSSTDCESTPISDRAIDITHNVCNFSETFPFIDFDACKNNVQSIANKLSFGKINFTDKIVAGNATCHQLNFFDDWLHLPSGYMVCPQFNSEIRSIITPFVTFILGIITFRFLVNRGQNGYK